MKIERHTVMALACAAGLLSGASAAPVVEGELETTLIRLSLDPEPLAAAGLSTGEVGELVADVAATDAFQNGDLAEADAAYADARRDADALGRLVKSGQASAQEVTDYQTALSTLATAESSRASVLDGLFTAGIADLSQGKKDLLATIRSNRSWRLLTHFLVIERSEAQWLELRAALDHERVCDEMGDTMDAGIVTLLANARAQTDVANAKSALDSSLSTIQSAWDAAVNP